MSNQEKKYFTEAEVKQALIEARVLGKGVTFYGSYTTIRYDPKTESYFWLYDCGDPECGCQGEEITKDVESLWLADSEYQLQPEQ